MDGIVDRIEGNSAVIEVDGETRHIPLSQVAPGVTSGDVVRLNDDGIWQKDEDMTAARSRQIKDKMDTLFE